MTSRDAYLGQRVETYDDQDVYADNGLSVAGLRIIQGRVSGTPTEDTHILRLQDLDTLQATIQTVSVSNVAAISAELAAYVGAFTGQLLLAYDSVGSYILYQYQPTGFTTDTPYIVSSSDTLGRWVAIAGTYINGAVVYSSNINTRGIFNSTLRKMTTVQTDVTNSAVFADVTGLSISLVAGITYKIKALLFVNTTASGGHKYSLGGTATGTVRASLMAINDDSTPAVQLAARFSNLVGAGSIGESSSAKTRFITRIEGYVACLAAGTLTIQIAQSVATLAESMSALIGSTLEADRFV